jgi:hypothetical protein
LPISEKGGALIEQLLPGGDIAPVISTTNSKNKETIRYETKKSAGIVH